MLSRPSARFAYSLAAVCLLLPLSVQASPEANIKLPPNPYGCQNCHAAPEVTPTTVPDTAIVPFTELGKDWAAQSTSEANRLWSDLATGNVDGDGCSNGFELGDPSGSYLPQDPPPADKSVSDPNAHDCTLPISGESWSRLKSLFDEN